MYRYHVLLFRKMVSLRSLDTFSSENYSDNSLGAKGGTGQLKSLCSALSNPFSGLTGLINSGLDVVSKAIALAQQFTSLFSGLFGGGLSVPFPGALNEALAAIKNAALSKMEAIKKQIEKSIENIIESVKTKLKNVAKQFDNVVQSVTGLMNSGSVQSIQEFVSSQITQAKNFFNDNNMEGLVAKTKDVIGRFVNQMTNLDKTNIASLLQAVLFMGCQLTSKVESFLNGPVNFLKELSDKFNIESNILSAFSGQNLAQSIIGGRPVMSTNQRRESKEQFLQRLQNERMQYGLNPPTGSTGGVGSVRPGGGVGASGGNGASVGSGTWRPNGTFNYNPKYSNHPDPDSWTTMDFSGVISGQKNFWKRTTPVNMVDYGGGSIIPAESGISDEISYYGLKLEVLERADAFLKSLQDQGILNGKQYINSAFRHIIYNQHIRNSGNKGAVIKSRHTAGEALDMSMPRGSYRNSAMAAARQFGFGGIGKYNTFIHVDIGPARTWGS